MTDLYNDVEDFWLNMDQGNNSCVLKQKSTGMLYGVGNQQNYTFGTYDAFVLIILILEIIICQILNYNIPVPMNDTDTSEVIDMKRSGSGNTDYRLRAFLLNTGRITTVGSGDFEGRGRGT